MKNLITILFFLFSLTLSLAQPVLLNEMVEAENLICFPVHGDKNTYKYLPSQGGLSITDGKPEFSFLQYAIENESTGLSASSINKALGGGLINFLVLYNTPKEEIKKAERALQRLHDNDTIRLVGPVEISSGEFLLVSSILKDGQKEPELIGSGRAPVFQNSKVAFSFMLTPEKSTLLMESFKSKTSDISIIFDLKFKGLTNAFNGKVTVDWSMVSNSSFSKSSVNAFFFSSDTEKTFQDLSQRGAIKMESYGENELAGGMLEKAYDKLLKMMYEPVPPDSINEANTKGWLAKTLGRPSDFLGGTNLYRKRVVRTSGNTIVELNSREMVERHQFVTFNIGDLYKKYGEDKTIFRKAALDEDLFKQREITVNVDGDLKADFNKMVNSVSVTVKKNHESGDETVKEVFYDTQKLEQYEGPMKLTYMNKEDADKEKWLEYEYAINWQFKKDGDYQTNWSKSSAPIINLYAPYKLHQVDLIGDVKRLKSEEIIAVVVQLEYPFFGRTKKEKQIIKPFNETNELSMSAIVPQDLTGLDYTITWIYKDGKKVQRAGIDDYGVLLIDEIPEGE